MNKNVKIIIGIVAFIATVVALHYIQAWLFQEEDNPIVVRKTYYNYLDSKIDSSWNRQTQWNEKLYNDLKTEITNKKAFNNITEKQCETLLKSNSYKASEAIVKFYESEMKKPECRKQDIIKNQEAVDKIRPSDNKNKNIIKADEMYKQYIATINFAEKEFTRKAELHGLTWEPFDRNKYDKKKLALSQGKYFNSHFKNINLVNNAWNTYDDKIRKAQTSYYKQIASLLEQELKNIELDQSTSYHMLDRNIAVLNDGIQEITYLSSTDKEGLLEELNSHKTRVERLKQEIDNSSRQWANAQGKFMDETQSVNDSQELNLSCVQNYLVHFTRSMKKNLDTHIEKTNDMIEKVSRL